MPDQNLKTLGAWDLIYTYRRYDGNVVLIIFHRRTAEIGPEDMCDIQSFGKGSRSLLDVTMGCVEVLQNLLINKEKVNVPQETRLTTLPFLLYQA